MRAVNSVKAKENGSGSSLRWGGGVNDAGKLLLLKIHESKLNMVYWDYKEGEYLKCYELMCKQGTIYIMYIKQVSIAGLLL